MKMLCPHCGVKGTADDSYIGKKVKCPKCEGTFEVESPEPLSPQEPGVQEVLDSPGEMTGGEDIEESVIAEPEESSEEETLEWSDIAVELDKEPKDGEETTDELEINEEDMIDEPAEEESMVVVEGPESDESAVEEVTILAGGDDSAPESTGEKTEVDLEEERSGIAPVLGSDVASTLRAQGFQGNDAALTEPVSHRPDFSVMGVIQDAWIEVKGIKASIWGGSFFMYLVLFVMAVPAAYFTPIPGSNEPMTATGLLVSVGSEILIGIVSVLFTAGLLYMGLRKIDGETFSWKMVFKGFSFSGRIILATGLQTILVGIGLVLFILPGIYLALGYGLTLPLIMDRQMSAWEAMEASRKAIHKVWWKVAGLTILMGIIYAISIIPLGIGLIWTVPMFILMVGVVYRRLF